MKVKTISQIFMIIFGFYAMQVYAEAEALELKRSSFSYPQTSFTLGYSSYKFQAKNANFDLRSENKAKSVNTYGFDMEVPYNDYANIGIYFRFDAFQNKSSEISFEHFNFRIANFLGAYTRFQYAPLQNQAFSLFTRADFGLGPVIMKTSGVCLQGALHAGFEFYVNRWIGLTFSYAAVEEWGRETLLDNSDEIEKQYKNIVLRASGHMIQFGLKTTYL